MSGIGILIVALVALVIGALWGLALFRADARRARETELAAFQYGATVRGPTVATQIKKLERDKRIPFHGRVRQQIRVIPPDAH